VNFIPNARQNPFGLRQYLVVIKPEHPQPSHLKELCSLPVSFGLPFFQMLATIDLDDQPQVLAAEIKDVGTERILAAKFRARQLAQAEEAPDQSLGVRRLRPQAARQ